MHDNLTRAKQEHAGAIAPLPSHGIARQAWRPLGHIKVMVLHAMWPRTAAQIELDEIDSARLAHGGIFGGAAAEGAVPPGQAACSDLLEECYGASPRCAELSSAKQHWLVPDWLVPWVVADMH